MPVGLIVYDYKKKIHLINKTAREILSIKPSEDISAALINRKFSIHKKPESKPSAAYDTNHFQFYQKGGNEIVLYRKELPCSIEGKEYVLSTFVDITSVDNARKYEAAANTAKSDFLAQMSHEIRTPMNGIIGMAEALAKEELTENQKEYITIIRRSADLLLNVIDDILDYSKIEAGKMLIEDIPFKLREEVNLAADIFRAVADEKGLIIQVNVDKDVPDKLIGDPFRLRQVLSNLISNSVKFTHQGKIVISVSIEETYSGNISLQFSVADTGVGIPKEKLSTIFNSFTQAEMSTSRKYGGSGLGTTICKQLVTLMNGEIWAESPSGISTLTNAPGTIFYFTIEVYSNADLTKNLDFGHITALKQVNALLISHQITAKKRLMSFLEHYKINTTIVNYGENILHDIQTKIGLKDSKYQLILIVDEIGLDGLWLAKRLAEENIADKYRMFLLSSNHKAENYIQSKLAGVDYYLVEPFDFKLFSENLLECFPHIEHKISEGIFLPKNISILVAEDNVINQKVALAIFGNLGFEIDIAPDGMETVKKIKSKAYDIVFMDLEMPEKDGIEATKEIRSNGYQMPIVAMTASASESTKNNSLKAGMNEYITKPVKGETVQAILEKWFA